MPFGGGDDQGMGRRAESRLGAVDLDAGRAAADQAEVADPLIVGDAVEDERGPRIEAVGRRR